MSTYLIGSFLFSCLFIYLWRFPSGKYLESGITEIVAFVAMIFYFVGMVMELTRRRQIDSRFYYQNECGEYSNNA